MCDNLSKRKYPETTSCVEQLDKSNDAPSQDDCTSNSMSNTESLSECSDSYDSTDFQEGRDTARDDREVQFRQLTTAARMLLELADLGPAEASVEVKVDLAKSGVGLVKFTMCLTELDPWTRNKLLCLVARNAGRSFMLY